jgi:alpha-ribazole phosphatase/probable phosphoglycerate mutase
MPLLFIRHAETALAGTFCGHTDPPVSLRGLEQIETLLSSLHDSQFTAVYTSDLRRAHTTAAALARAHNAPLIPRPALREINFGRWEGLRWPQIEALDPAAAQLWLDQYPGLPAPGGEPFQDFQARILTEVAFLQHQTAEGLAAVVTHAGVLRVILQSLCKIDQSLAHTITKPYCCFFRYPPALIS